MLISSLKTLNSYIINLNTWGTNNINISVSFRRCTLFVVFIELSSKSLLYKADNLICFVYIELKFLCHTIDLFLCTLRLRIFT